MQANIYQQLAFRTAKTDSSKQELLIECCLGLAGEAGEVCDLVKKQLFQGHNMENIKLANELGDVVWYVATAATALGYTFDEILTMNIEKLEKRYPNGFESQRSINRTE